MTSGSPMRLLIVFALPLMLGNMFQQCYTIADTLIVSRRLGVDALAALGSADWFIWFIISIIQALTQGFSILLAQQFGADDRKGLRVSYAQSVLLCVLFAASLLTVSEISVPFILRILNVPEPIRPLARLYIVIFFAGIPAQMLYNFTASVLRAFGNSRTPFTAMVFASLLNIALDILFVLVLSWGVAGAAAATVISQAASALWCYLAVRRVEQVAGIKAGELRPKWQVDRHLLVLAAPVVLQNILISVGGMIVASVVNTFGVDFVAGYTATNKLYGALEMAAVAYGFACMTYAGQNYGAGNMARVRRGFRQGMVLAVITSAVIGLLAVLFGRLITGAFLTGDPARVAAAGDIAYRFLFILGISLPILYILYVARSTLQGLGDTVMPMVSGLGEFVMRVFMAVVVSRFIGYDAVFYGEVAAWLGADAVLVTAVLKRLYGRKQ